MSCSQLSSASRRSTPLLLITALLTLGAALSVAACGKGKNGIPGIDNFNVGVVKQRLYVSFVATALHWNDGLSIPIPGIPDSSVSVGPDLQSDGTVFQFGIGLKTLLDQTEPHFVSGLPDGRPLPDVSSGQLPRWDFKIRDINVSLYLSNDAFGFFVPLRLEAKGIALTQTVSVDINDENGNRLGRAYGIPSSNVSGGGSGSGVFILLPFIRPEVDQPKTNGSN